MVPTTIWHIEDEARFANFRKVTQNTKFKAGEGLPGRILETKKAVWIRNVGEDPNFPRAKLTKDISSHAGFGVPVLFGDNVVAVLEFFSTEVNDPDGAFLHVVANIGTHLGRLIERTRAEAALRASEERFRVFAESASDRFWEMDEGLRFTFHSGAPRVKSGFEPEETIGKTPWEIYGIDPDRDDHWRRHKEDLENHRPFRDFRHSFVDEGGQKYHWSVSGTPVFGKDGDFKGYSGTATNIGERVEAEEHLREAKEDAELANRAKSEFLSGMSHELRTPLNAIIGFSELIERESFGPLANDKYAEYVTYIHASGSHLLDLVNDILDIAAVESGRLELNEGILDVGAIAEAAFRMVKSHAETGGIELTRALEPHLSGLFADERKVKQIVLNLLTNAVKFTPEGGRVSLEARLEDDAMALVVADTGVGMNEDSLTKALTKFGQVNSQLSRNNQGTGLGLPLVKGLMEAHSGTLELTSEIGVGATATVRFPKERIVS